MKPTNNKYDESIDTKRRTARQLPSRQRGRAHGTDACGHGRARAQTRADARAHAARALSCYNDGLPRGVNAAGKPAPPPSCGKAAAEVLGITSGVRRGEAGAPDSLPRV